MKSILYKILFGAVIASSSSMAASLLPVDIPSTSDDFRYVMNSNSGGTGNYTGKWTQGMQGSGITGTMIETCLKEVFLREGSGWYFGLSNGQNACQTDVKGISGTTNGFSMIGRQGYGGEWAASVIDITAPTTNISLSFDYNLGGNTSFVSLWKMDAAGNITSIKGATQLTSSSFDSGTLSTSLSETDKLVIIFGASSAGQTMTVSNITLSSDAIPEPSGIALSLVGMACFIYRRKRNLIAE